MKRTVARVDLSEADRRASSGRARLGLGPTGIFGAVLQRRASLQGIKTPADYCEPMSAMPGVDGTIEEPFIQTW